MNEPCHAPEWRSQAFSEIRVNSRHPVMAVVIGQNAYSMSSKLRNAEDTPIGCVLVLGNDLRIRLDVNYDDLNDYLTGRGFPALRDVCASGDADVFYRPIQMTLTEWVAISTILKGSETVTSTLADFPVLANRLHLTFDVVSTLANRVYGGIGEPVPGASPTFYLSAPIDFTRPTDRDDSWRYALLSHRGGHLFKTYVKLTTGAVEIEHGIVENHFVERRSDVAPQ